MAGKYWLFGRADDLPYGKTFALLANFLNSFVFFFIVFLFSEKKTDRERMSEVRIQLEKFTRHEEKSDGENSFQMLILFHLFPSFVSIVR